MLYVYVQQFGYTVYYFYLNVKCKKVARIYLDTKRIFIYI
jgi:hypothetical protein